MLFRQLADLAKVVQGVIERYYGMYAKLLVMIGEDGKEVVYEPPPYAALCKELGIGLHGASIVLYSPTGKPALHFRIHWKFTVEEVGREKQYWGRNLRWAESDKLPLYPQTELSQVEVALEIASPIYDIEDRTDLRCRVREALKEHFKQVTFRLEDPHQLGW